MKRPVSFIVCIILLASLFSAACAEEIQSRAVIGADLTEEQIQAVYKTFKKERGSIKELKLTNEDEQKYLDGLVDSSVIGTRSISCVYLELLAPGSGLDVSTSNISSFTAQMYENALSTVGIRDARLIVTAPFPVSGTAAIAGIYKAYEDISKEELDSNAKSAGTQELTVTEDLAREIGSDDSMSIVQELKLMISETSKMSDKEMGDTIGKLASKYHVTLTDTQVTQLITLCRTLEKIDPQSIKSKVEDVQTRLGGVSGIREKISGFFASIKELFEGMQTLIVKIQEILDRF